MKSKYHLLNAFFLVVLILFFGNSVSCHGQKVDLTQKIDHYLQATFDKGNIPGFTVAVVKDDEIILAKGYGKSGSKNFTSDTPLPIASLSKAFTALAILQLVESGKINLDTTVSIYYPSFPLSAAGITVRQLLNQTSGLTDKFFPEMQYYQQPKDLDSSIDRLRGIKFEPKAVEKFHYHNPNYQILARIIELVSKQSYTAYLAKNIFEPLGLKHTNNVALTQDLYSPVGGNITEGYNYIIGKHFRMKELNWFVEGSAGITSTSDDLAKWLILFLNQGSVNGVRLLNPENVKLMLSPSNKAGSSYGMGWSINNQNIASHSGLLWTYQAEQRLDLEKGFGVVMLFNSGLNVFQDYGSVCNGILEIINGKGVIASTSISIYIELLMGIMLLLSIYFGIKYVKIKKDWRQKSTIHIILNILIKLIPLLILLSIPQIMILISGRVLNWERIFWMMPSIVIYFVIQSGFNIVVAFLRLRPLWRNEGVG